jgi:hypothetical protein
MHRTASWRRTIKDALLSIGALLIVLVVVTAADERVRQEFRSNLSSERASEGIADTTTQAHVVVHIIKDQSERHGPLLVMVVAGTMLALFMFRT